VCVPEAAPVVGPARISQGLAAAEDCMSTLTIRHLTTYRYRQPVAFGEHRMMLLPRDCARQRVIESRLMIDPEPVSLEFIQDGFGNHIGIARFSGRARALRIESLVAVEHSPPPFAGAAADAFPPDYPGKDRAELAGFLGDAVDGEVADWARRFLPATGGIGSWSLLCSLSDAIHRDFRYSRREAKGIQTPRQTLALGEGSCRDFAVLMIAATRALGFAARFASGYLAVPLDRPSEPPEDADGGAGGHGSTHAWAQIYLPLLGWIDFDPTNGTIGPQNLVTVAVVEQPEDATPLHGTFLGFPSDHIGMDVAVTITKAPPTAA
jgi:transglutaminase-like putative cysteine protease